MGEEARADAGRHHAAAVEARRDPRGGAGLTISSDVGSADGEPRPVRVEHDGLTVAALDWGGDGVPLLLLHPNGFPAGIFDPLARRLTDAFRPIAIDLRAHGGTDVPAGAHDAYAYSRLAADVVAVLDSLGVDEVVALGESLGGGVAIMVDAMRPRLVQRMMLCEAIAFDLAALGPAGIAGRPRDGENFMATIARKRRAVWPDRATVRASYGSRPPLDAMDSDALDAYVRWGFVERADGQVELACPPEAEAMLFELGPHEDGAGAAWRHLSAMHAEVVVLAGTGSDLPQQWFRGQAEHAGAPFVEVAGGHFFVQEDTARAEGLVRKYLQQ